MELFCLVGTICYLECDRIVDIEIKISFGYGDYKKIGLVLYIPKIRWSNQPDYYGVHQQMIQSPEPPDPDDLPF